MDLQQFSKKWLWSNWIYSDNVRWRRRRQRRCFWIILEHSRTFFAIRMKRGKYRYSAAAIRRRSAWRSSCSAAKHFSQNGESYDMRECEVRRGRSWIYAECSSIRSVSLLHLFYLSTVSTTLFALFDTTSFHFLSIPPIVLDHAVCYLV